MRTLTELDTAYGPGPRRLLLLRRYQSLREDLHAAFGRDDAHHGIDRAQRAAGALLAQLDRYGVTEPEIWAQSRTHAERTRADRGRGGRF